MKLGMGLILGFVLFSFASFFKEWTIVIVEIIAITYIWRTYF